jgi:hypothetical protein
MTTHNPTVIPEIGIQSETEPGSRARSRPLARLGGWLLTRRQLPAVAPVMVLAAAALLAVAVILLAQTLFAGGWAAGFAWHLTTGNAGANAVLSGAGTAADGAGARLEELGWALNSRFSNPVSSSGGAVVLALATLALIWLLLRMALTFLWGLSFAPARFWVWLRHRQEAQRQEAQQLLVEGTSVRLVVDGDIAAITRYGVTLRDQSISVSDSASSDAEPEWDDTNPDPELRSVSVSVPQ